MIKTGTSFVAALLLAVLLAGCTASPGKTLKSGKLSVYTSFYPMYDFAKKIGGDKIELTNMIPAGTEPHDWEPTASDIVNLEKADVFIYNGAGMELWVDKVLASLQNKDLIVLETSKGLPLITHEENSETVVDAHVWLNPAYAKLEAEAIKNALVSADPANTETYEANFASCSKQFDSLDQEYRETLTACPNKDIIVAHQAFGYLCSAYGLTQVSIEGLSPDSEPDPARMAEIIGFAKDHAVKVIFFEDLVSPKVAQTISSAVGARTETLNPLEGLTDAQLTSGEDYFTIMKKNLQSLKEALQ